MAYRLMYISCPIVLLSFAASRYMYTFHGASVDATDEFSMLQSRMLPTQSDRNHSRDVMAASVLSKETALEQGLVSIQQNHSQVKKQLGLLEVQERSANQDLAQFPLDGAKDCPCIGIEGLKGALKITLGNGSSKRYPADLGTRCSTWNDKDAPWAGPKRWCYVDPCNCQISPQPQPSVFLPGAEYQGHAVYFSYETCGSTTPSTNSTDNTTDNDTAANASDTDTIDDICASPGDAAVWGDVGCPCIGISGQSGYLNISIKGAITKFPADYGSKCSAWDQHTNPDCTTSKGPLLDWCVKSWCYVDPCSCNASTPPRASGMHGADVNEKHVFWSYTTCGSTDTDSPWKEKIPCVDRNTPSICSRAPDCAWTGTTCLAKELVDACYAKSEAPSLFWPIAIGAVVGVAVIGAVLYYCFGQ